MSPRKLHEEVEREPFIPIRLHLSSGKAVDLPHAGAAWPLSYGLMVFHGTKPGRKWATGYDVINYRLIERVEQLDGRRRNGRARRSA